MKKQPISPKKIEQYVERVVGEEIHQKRALSIANAAIGVISAVSLCLHSIGHALAKEKGLNDKHAIKQIDRYLSNEGINLWQFFKCWIPIQIGPRKEVTIALDWTDFQSDDHATITLYLVTTHGRATPLLWMTVVKSQMEGWRNAHEYSMLAFLKEALPKDVWATILADRGFGDHKLYEYLKELGLDYIIRFKQNILLTDCEGRSKPAGEWVLPTGEPVMLKKASVTLEKYEVPAVVCVKEPGMKESWCLATSLSKSTAKSIIERYAKRFSIEEGFRDLKDSRYGMGLSATHISDSKRRDRLLLAASLATVFLTLLGAAGESMGLDRMLKANTVKKRTHSLFRQGSLYFDKLPNMKPDLRNDLLKMFGQLLHQQAFHLFLK